MRVAVAGGTGTVGAHVMDALRAAGHDPIALARSTGVDLVSGAGLDAALDGADVVIDVSNRSSMRKKSAVEFFTAVTSHLLDAVRRHQVRHLVTLSIVGIDRVPLGYYEGKLAQERLLLDADAPVTVLRATQFHEFVDQTLRRVPGPIAVAPNLLIQPIAASEVAAELARLAGGDPIGMAPEIAGPRQERLPMLARKLMAARRSRRLLLTVGVPGRLGKAWRSGGLLPTREGPRGTVTFDAWLAASR